MKGLLLMSFVEFLRSDVFEAYWITALIAYLLGSLNFAIIFSWLFERTDVRNYGSGNAGATNVLRSVGLVPGILTIIFDFAKGLSSMLLSQSILVAVCGDESPYTAEKSICFCVAGLFALIGHIFPVFFKFRGGKGMMTLAGIIIILSPLRFLMILTVFFIGFGLTRTVSIGSCACGVFYPAITLLELYFFRYRVDPVTYNREYLITQTVLALVFGITVLITHRQNIKRIINGTEPKTTIKKKTTA